MGPLRQVTADPTPPSPEEEAAWEEAYRAFAALHEMYDKLIEAEVCPDRRRFLEILLSSLREDNK